MGSMIKTVSLLALVTALAGCANMGVFKDSSAPQANDLAPVPDPMPATPSAVPAAQIKTLLTGKSWRWVGPKNSGVTLYASDGTSLVEVTGKGTTGGKWSVKDGQLCESFNPAPFIPQGVPNTCQPFTNSGGKYTVGQASFALAS
jgi:Protein of unknown function (DUF995)